MGGFETTPPDSRTDPGSQRPADASSTANHNPAGFPHLRPRPILAVHHVHRGTRSLRREGIARLGLWMRYHVVGADALAPRSGLNDLITLQNWWSGAGSNRRPSAFQAHSRHRSMWLGMA